MGAPNYNPPSRFLDEIPETLIDWNKSASGFTSPPTNKEEICNATTAQSNRKTEHLITTFCWRSRFTRYLWIRYVISVSGEGEKAEATINFGSLWRERLLLRYAPVDKL